MVALISKAEIQNKNIDMVEKAILFGALALRSALIGADNSQVNDRKVSIRISPSREPPSYLSIDIYLPFDAYKYNVSGGLALESLGELTSNSLSLEADLVLTSQPTDSSLVMPDYDELEIDTFEKYIFYYSRILWAALEEKRNNIIKISPQGNQDNPEFFIDLSLPINLDSWLSGSNYLDSLELAVTSYGTDQASQIVIPEDTPLYVFNALTNNFSEEDFYDLFTLPFPGILISIEVDADFPDGFDYTSMEFYIDSNYVPFNFFSVGENGFPLLTWTEGTIPMPFAPGVELSVYVYENELPTYIDLYITLAQDIQVQ